MKKITKILFRIVFMASAGAYCVIVDGKLSLAEALTAALCLVIATILPCIEVMVEEGEGRL